MEVIESRFRHSMAVAAVTRARAGFGSSTTPHYDKAQGKDRRALILEEVWASVEE